MTLGPVNRARVLGWFDQLARWTTRGFWAIADQALFAISNLIINVLLARWLSPREYGAFVTSYVVLLLVGVAHGGLLVEPMLVYGPSRYGRRFGEYLSTLLRFQVGFGAVAMAALLLVGAAAYGLGARELAATFVGMGFASPFIFLSWLVRRACYVERKPAVAATGGAIYLILIVTGAGLLYRLELLTSMAAQLLMGAASGIAAVIILRRIEHSWRALTPAAETRRIWREHWEFFRWSGSAGLVFFAQGVVFYLLLPLFGGLEATAALRAMTNFVMPVLQSDSALSLLVAPELARARQNPLDLARITRWSTRLFAVEGALCWLFVAVFRHDLVRLAYGDRYLPYADLLLVLGAMPIIASRVNILGALLRVHQQVRLVFVACVAATIVSLAIGLATMSKFGALGASVAMIAAEFVRMSAMTYFLARPRVVVSDPEGESTLVGPTPSARVLEVRQ